MKKFTAGIIAIATLVALGSFAGCKDPENTPSTDVNAVAEYIESVYRNSNKSTRKDYTVTNSYVDADDNTYTITWSVDVTTGVVVKSNGDTSTIDIDETVTTELPYVLTATISDGYGNSTTVVFNRTIAAVTGDSIIAPAENTAYNMYIEQLSTKNNLLLTGKMDGSYLGMTTNNAEAANVYAEKADGGYKFYVLGDNDAKSYITLTESLVEGKDYYKATVSYSETGSVFYYDALGCWGCVMEHDTFYLGTNQTYETGSASSTFYMTAENIGKSQFPMLLALPNTVTGGGAGEKVVLTDPESILNLLYGLEKGASTVGEFTLTGKITNLDSYNNPTIVVEGFENKPVYCYKLVVTNAVGDTITVKATTLTNFDDSKYEFVNCTLISSVPGEGGNVDGGGEGGTPSVTSSLEENVAYTVSANNSTDKLYLDGTISGGRFNCTTSEADAVSVYVENVSGGQLLYFLNNGVKTYFVFADKAAGGSTTTDATAATVFEWNATLSTLVVADDTNNRAFGSSSTSTYTNFSSYDASQSGYNWGQFTPVAAN